MDEFARRPVEDRRTFNEEAASRRDVMPIIIEKDLWVMREGRRLTVA